MQMIFGNSCCGLRKALAGPDVDVRIESDLPSHAGFGSKTTVLALGKACATLCNKDVSSAYLAALARRAATWQREPDRQRWVHCRRWLCEPGGLRPRPSPLPATEPLRSTDETTLDRAHTAHARSYLDDVLEKAWVSDNAEVAMVAEGDFDVATIRPGFGLMTTTRWPRRTASSTLWV
jgi:hypothetical protein